MNLDKKKFGFLMSHVMSLKIGACLCLFGDCQFCLDKIYKTNRTDQWQTD